MDIISKDTKIFKKEYEGKTYYRASLTKKLQDGSYEYGYIDVKFPKGTDIENKTKIDITKGFLSFYKTKEEKDVYYIVVQEYSKKDEEIKQENSKENTTNVYEQFGKKTEFTAEEIDDLPF